MSLDLLSKGLFHSVRVNYLDNFTRLGSMCSLDNKEWNFLLWIVEWVIIFTWSSSITMSEVIWSHRYVCAKETGACAFVSKQLAPDATLSFITVHVSISLQVVVKLICKLQKLLSVIRYSYKIINLVTFSDHYSDLKESRIKFWKELLCLFYPR